MNCSREFESNGRDLSNGFSTGFAQVFDTPKRTEKRLPSTGAYAGNCIENTRNSPFASEFSVVGDGKSMGFISDPSEEINFS